MCVCMYNYAHVSMQTNKQINVYMCISVVVVCEHVCTRMTFDISKYSGKIQYLFS